MNTDLELCVFLTSKITFEGAITAERLPRIEFSHSVRMCHLSYSKRTDSGLVLECEPGFSLLHNLEGLLAMQLNVAHLMECFSPVISFYTACSRWSLMPFILPCVLCKMSKCGTGSVVLHL